MIQIKFKNLEKSELAKEAVLQRVKTLVEKFQDLKKSRLVVTLQMENSPIQTGPDFFSVKLQVFGGRFNRIIISKADSNLYKALAEMVDHLLEKLNRAGDKARVKLRNKARQVNKIIEVASPKELLALPGGEAN